MFNCKMIAMDLVLCDMRVMDPLHLNANVEDLEALVHYFGPICLDLFGSICCWKFQIATFKRLLKFFEIVLYSLVGPVGMKVCVFALHLLSSNYK